MYAIQTVIESKPSSTHDQRRRLKPATPEDASFVESIYFETQRWIIEKLFGWRGDDFEHAKFRDNFYHEQDASIIVAGGKPVGWIAIGRNGKTIHVDHVYLTTEAQRHGIGTTLFASSDRRGEGSRSAPNAQDG
ncbi:MAG: GNAT family N-acetyltransferase [Candidatus Cybelea sp.]